MSKTDSFAVELIENCAETLSDATTRFLLASGASASVLPAPLILHITCDCVSYDADLSPVADAGIARSQKEWLTNRHPRCFGSAA